MFYSSEGQTFVDDVDRVAFVVIDYCIDSSGNRYNITINEDKTTYLKKDWQEACITHFKDAELPQSMKMLDRCWQIVYYFVNSKYKTYSLPEEDREKCTIFHTGEYRYIDSVHYDFKIVRRKNKQIEKSLLVKNHQVYAIQWLDDHIYTLETLKVTLEKDKDRIGDLMEVEIIELLDGDSYLYRATIKEKETVFFGVIQKVTD
ncbi:hypothetical protein [Psychroserpens sp. AS72]|uniref:hypothetical protein n=1 Tax=Psychroserpens sp. AS72 TaxID=3135775 RepID=UPI00319E2499